MIRFLVGIKHGEITCTFRSNITYLVSAPCYSEFSFPLYQSVLWWSPTSVFTWVFFFWVMPFHQIFQSPMPVTYSFSPPFVFFFFFLIPSPVFYMELWEWFFLNKKCYASTLLPRSNISGEEVLQKVVEATSPSILPFFPFLYYDHIPFPFDPKLLFNSRTNKWAEYS